MSDSPATPLTRTASAGAGLDLAALVRGRLVTPEDPATLALELPALAATAAAASLAPGLTVALFPEVWHMCWSGFGLPALTLGLVLAGAPAVRAVHQAAGNFLPWSRIMHAVLATSTTLALWSLLTLPLIVAAGLFRLPEPTLHMLVAGPIGVGAVFGMLGLSRTLPPPPSLPRTTRIAAAGSLAVAAAAVAGLIGTCGDPHGSLLPAALPPLVSIGAAWLLGGLATGLLFRRRGIGSLSGALFAWPLLLPLLGRPRDEPAAPAIETWERGPLAMRIDATLRRLDETLGDADATGADCRDEARALRCELLTADARLGVADRILAEPELASAGNRGAVSLSRSVAELQEKRRRAATEIETVLDALHELRVQVGILTLAGEAAPVRQRLEGLRARIAALQEVELRG